LFVIEPECVICLWMWLFYCRDLLLVWW